MKVRRIGGLQFALVHECKRKAEAKEEAQLVRRGGYNARVVKAGSYWPTRRVVMPGVHWQVWREVV